ncbi:thioredoxin fold domain-containing protein [Saccharicrinis sp. FJH62]|uniref:thioredoxin fold domain-containing protein n=1 Tax=Saccharicrinis sp. FJH62 TaxID=3344657 RepID=UPI0035D43DE4
MKRIALIMMVLTVMVSLHAEEKKWSQDYTKVNFNEPSTELYLIYFSGSDWCKPCIKMKAELLDSNEFMQYAKDFKLYQADFPYRTKQEKPLKKFNETLADKYDKDGQFPYLVVVNGQGERVFATGYKDIPVTSFIKLLDDGIHKK